MVVLKTSSYLVVEGLVDRVHAARHEAHLQWRAWLSWRNPHGRDAELVLRTL